MPSVSAMSSAVIGCSARYSSPWIWLTERFTPHWSPMSPQCRIKRWTAGGSFLFPVVSVMTEISDRTRRMSRVHSHPVCHREPAGDRADQSPRPDLPESSRADSRHKRTQTMTASDKAFTGSIPQLYDQLLVPIIFTPYARDLAQRIKSRRPGDLLETAAGTGAVTRILAAELPVETRITATDLSEPMLMQAKTHLGGETRIRWQQADALALPFADASFDTVVCQFGVMFF